MLYIHRCRERESHGHNSNKRNSGTQTRKEKVNSQSREKSQKIAKEGAPEKKTPDVFINRREK
jgi:hypothetical protein